MPTKLHRIQVSMPAATLKILRRIAKEQRLPVATTITRYLDESAQGLEAYATALEQSREARTAAAAFLGTALGKAEKRTDAALRKILKEERDGERGYREAQSER